MKILGAVVKEQGVTFAIVLVKPSAMQTNLDASRTREESQALFPGLPIILASQETRGRFKYSGREDIVKFLASIDPARIPWKKYTFSE